MRLCGEGEDRYDGMTAFQELATESRLSENNEDKKSLLAARILEGSARTVKPQGSIRIKLEALIISIKSIYFLQISTGFNKSFDLLWEQRC